MDPDYLKNQLFKPTISNFHLTSAYLHRRQRCSFCTDTNGAVAVLCKIETNGTPIKWVEARFGWTNANKVVKNEASIS